MTCILYCVIELFFVCNVSRHGQRVLFCDQKGEEAQIQKIALNLSRHLRKLFSTAGNIIMWRRNRFKDDIKLNANMLPRQEWNHQQ